MARRTEKFKEKISGKLMGAQFDAQKREMVRKQGKYFTDAERIEKTIKTLLSSESTHNIIYYIIFAKEIIKLMKIHSAETLREELCLKLKKWRARGLENAKLNKIRVFLAGGTRNCGACFILDASLLDGPDELC